MFKAIHDMIVEDNVKSNVEPMGASQPSHIANPVNGGNSSKIAPQRPLSMPSPPEPDFESAGALPSAMISMPTRQRPPVHPKPDRLHSPIRATHGNGDNQSAPGDILAERFAQLRIPRGNLSPAKEKHDLGFVDMPSPTTFTRNSSIAAAEVNDSYSNNNSSNGKIMGPRNMPQLPAKLPPPPPKIPLAPSSAASLPRAPSPTYNPAKDLTSSTNLPSPGDSTYGGSPIKMSASSPFKSSNGDTYTPRTASINNASGFGPTSALDLINTTMMTAEELYEQIRTYSVLLIDVRSREDFDQGHIFATSIICIEPLSLRSGVPADDLEERLVVSPEPEQRLFERRNEFDLVVYYDQRTRSSRFLDGSPINANPAALRALHDTLYQFNYDKALRRPPVLLLGGLDAWVDLVGHQALQTSNTVEISGKRRAIRPSKGPGRPIGRVRMATFNSSQEVRKRRLREQVPLKPEEERAWLDKVRNEEVAPPEPEQTQSDGEFDQDVSPEEQPISPLAHSYEDFLRRFPEASAVQQSMVSPGRLPSRRPIPIVPPIPSRPAPAVPRPSYGGVSERDSNALSPTSRDQVSAQPPPPLYRSRTISSHFRLPRTGLINFSVTCYMNATVQCLSGTIPVAQFFLDNRWRDFVQKNWKGSEGIMPGIFANVVRALWRGDVSSVRPSSLRNFSGRLNPEWGVDRQQDAKEYLDFLLDTLHEDLNQNWRRNPLHPLTTEQEMVRERTPIAQVSLTEWNRYTHREASFISEIFAGQHASRLRCTTCGNTSTTYEAFYSISVEIPRSGRGDIRECLRSYCQEEMLSGDEVWKCPYCKCEREATKRITITRVPQVLVIHFKRFSASKTESARKVHTSIDFPLHGLDMQPYTANAMLPKDSGSSDVDYSVTPPFLYDAYAVLRHLGNTGNGGHYISLVKDTVRGCWRKYDDEKIVDFDPNKLRSDQRLQNQEAYIVFYGRSHAR